VTDPSTHLFWITSRAAGTTAMALSGVSVSLGLMMGGRLRRSGAPDRRVLHEALSLAVLLAIVVHGLALVGDQYLRPGLAGVTVPFVLSYKTAWTTLGIVSGWGLIALGLGFYARRWIGPQRFRIMHRFTALVWLGGLAHSLGEGTDAGQTWFLALLAVTTLPAMGLLCVRWLGGGRRGRATATPLAAHTAAPAPSGGGAIRTLRGP
jgi:sulfoxide reductase heme-binding subunit YedZ